MRTPAQNNGCKPEIVDYIALDSLLAGYTQEPLISGRYMVSTCDEEGQLSDNIMETLQARLGFGQDIYCSLERVVVECVQNIMQHCYGNADIKAYTSEDNTHLIAAFELNEETQFGKDGLEKYRQMLNTVCITANSPDYGKTIQNLMQDDCADESSKSNDFHLGTTMIMRTKNLTRAGIADIGKRAYFFFEYSLPQKNDGQA
jgi:hypothetical protein